jgi:hypothetical protein
MSALVERIAELFRFEAHVASGVQKSRQPRNYSAPALARAKLLFPQTFIDTMRQIGFDNADVFLARLRTLPLAIAGGHSFDAIWDDAMDDERLSESEKGALSVQAVEMLEQDLRAEGLL